MMAWVPWCTNPSTVIIFGVRLGPDQGLGTLEVVFSHIAKLYEHFEALAARLLKVHYTTLALVAQVAMECNV